MTSNRISVQNLYFGYDKETPVLKGINLNFNDCATAIIGENGSGKTTFVKLLKGLLKPVSGSIYLKGRNIAGITVAKLARDIGLVFQNPNDQIFKSTVLDEVLFGPLNIGQTMDQAKFNAEKALDLVGLSQFKQIHPYDLGLSDRKLVCIAAILAMDTEIIIFDEPTIAQDYCGKERIKQIIKTLKSQGKLVITITHDLDFVAETFERIIVFHDGQVLLDDHPRAVFQDQALLKDAHLELPSITQLGRRLGFKDTLLTIDELIKQIKSKTWYNETNSL